MKRLPPFPAQRIKQDKELTFSYRGRNLTGLEGDSVATALYANGVRIFSRSFKYHRPRGLYSLDGESATCLLQIDHVPNVDAGRPCYDPGWWWSRKMSRALQKMIFGVSWINSAGPYRQVFTIKNSINHTAFGLFSRIGLEKWLAWGSSIPNFAPAHARPYT